MYVMYLLSRNRVVLCSLVSLPPCDMAPKKKRKTEGSASLNIGEMLFTGVSKTAIGLLRSTGQASCKLNRTAIRRSIQQHASFNTPHGTVVQTMSIGQHVLEYIHPAALLFYLCSISGCFRGAMEHAHSSAADGVFSVLLYSDAATPGNPFRPDKGRKFEAFYW